MCVEERRESTQDREKADTMREKKHARGVLPSVSTQRRQGKQEGEEKHMQQAKLTREWESMSKRKAKHIQKRGKTCLRQIESSGEGKQKREEVSNQE